MCPSPSLHGLSSQHNTPSFASSFSPGLTKIVDHRHRALKGVCIFSVLAGPCSLVLTRCSILLALDLDLGRRWHWRLLNATTSVSVLKCWSRPCQNRTRTLGSELGRRDKARLGIAIKDKTRCRITLGRVSGVQLLSLLCFIGLEACIWRQAYTRTIDCGAHTQGRSQCSLHCKDRWPFRYIGASFQVPTWPFSSIAQPTPTLIVRLGYRRGPTRQRT